VTRTPETYWSIPPLWLGETAVIIASGPSLIQQDVDYCRGKARVIVVNNNYQVAPWADLHYFADARWYHNYGKSDEYKGKTYVHKEHPLYLAFTGLKVTIKNNRTVDSHILNLNNGGSSGLEIENKDTIRTGQNSGYQAINIATHLGVKRILLLGLDMKFMNGKAHHHADHPHQLSEKTIQNNMLPRFPTLVSPLKKLGIEVVNCSRSTAIKCFRRSLIQDEI